MGLEPARLPSSLSFPQGRIMGMRHLNNLNLATEGLWTNLPTITDLYSPLLSNPRDGLVFKPQERLSVAQGLVHAGQALPLLFVEVVLLVSSLGIGAVLGSIKFYLTLCTLYKYPSNNPLRAGHWCIPATPDT